MSDAHYIYRVLVAIEVIKYGDGQSIDHPLCLMLGIGRPDCGRNILTTVRGGVCHSCWLSCYVILNLIQFFASLSKFEDFR